MKKIFTLLTISVVLCGCATNMSQLQRRAIESKELEGKFEDAYKSTIQVFQDCGYVIKNSDYQSGIIQGETGIKQSWLGTMINNEITATLEQFGDNMVKERISLVRKTKISSQYGTNEDSQIVEDPELFQKIYEDIQKEMFVRRNLNK